MSAKRRKARLWETDKSNQFNFGYVQFESPVGCVARKIAQTTLYSNLEVSLILGKR